MSHRAASDAGDRGTAATAAAGPGLRTWLWLFVACLAGLALRSPDALLNPQFWAEDGAVFFVQQRGADVPPLLQPYAGYLHLLPRLVAWGATAFPLALAPTVYVLGAWLAAGAAWAYFLHRLLPWRLALGGAVGLLLTPTSGEVFGSLTNVQWQLQFGLLAACLAPAPGAGRALRIGLPLAVLVAALTGPFSLLLVAVLAALALAAWPLRALRAPWRHLLADGGRWRLAALVAGALVQAVVLVRDGAAAGGGYSAGGAVVALVEWTASHLLLAGLPTAVFVVVTATVVVAALRWNGGGAAGAFLIAGMLVLAALEIVAASGKADVIGADLGYGDRYFFLMKVALAICLFAPWAARARAAAAALALACAVAALLPERHLQRPPMEDLRWRKAIAPVAEGRRAVVPIHPRPWKIVVKP